MASKIWNIILLILIGGLIIGIFLNEISYNRFSRSDYYIYFQNKEGVNSKLLENRFITKDDTIDVPDRENHWSVDEKLLPEKLHLLWFSFEDDTFYEFNGEIDYNLIRKRMKKDGSIGVEFGKHGTFTLKVNDEVAQNLKGTEVLKPWFDKDVNRDAVVFFARNKVEITPYLNLESGSEFSDVTFSPVTFYYLSNPSDFADTLVNGKLLRENQPAKTRPFDKINLKITKNAGMKPKSEEYFFAPVLKVKIDLDANQLYGILRNNPINQFDLKINLDKNDSLKSVYLSNQKENFKLKTTAKYELQSNQTEN